MKSARLVMLLTLCISASIANANQVEWVFTQPFGNVDSSPSLVDINADGRDELIGTTVAGCVIALDHKGALCWNSNLKIPFSIGPTTTDILEDSTPEVLVLNQMGTLYCLSSQNGAQMWTYDLPADIEWGTTSIAVSDLDNDGVVEIVTGTKRGQVVCLSNEGILKWQYDGDHGVTLSPAIGSKRG